MIHLWNFSLDTCLYSVDTCAQLLSFEETERAAKFAFPFLKRRFTLARGCLRILLGKYLNKHPQKIEFTYNVHGKPFLKEDPQLHFNLSHSEDRVIYGITRSGPLGVDIECVRDIKLDESLCHMIMTSREMEWFYSFSKEERLRKFFYLWTCKEALVKARGIGLAFPLNQIEIPFDCFGVCLISCESWFLHLAEEKENYITTLATQEIPVKISHFHHRDLLRSSLCF